MSYCVGDGKEDTYRDYGSRGRVELDDPDISVVETNTVLALDLTHAISTSRPRTRR